MNILHVRSTIGFYGAEKVIFNLLPALQDKNLKVRLVSIEGSQSSSGILADKMRSSGIETLPVKCLSRYDSEVVNEIDVYIKNNNINIIHTHDYKSFFYLYFLSKRYRIPLVHHMHGTLGNSVSEKLYSIIEKTLCLFVSKVLVVSRSQLNKLFFYPHIEFIRNGIILPEKIRHYTNCLSKSLHVSIVARLTPEKQHLLAIQSIEKLIKENSKYNVILNIYGDGPLSSELVKYVDTQNLHNNVIFNGFVDNIEEVYLKTDVLLICSKTEGLPMCLLEAMSYGVPVISTRVGEVTDIVSKSNSGILVYNNVTDISDAILNYICDNNKLIIDSSNARKYVENNYTIDKQASSIIKIYKKILCK